MVEKQAGGGQLFMPAIRVLFNRTPWLGRSVVGSGQLAEGMKYL